MAADLLRAPPPTKQLGDHSAELVVGVDAASVMPRPSRSGASVRLEGLILMRFPSVAPGRVIPSV